MINSTEKAAVVMIHGVSPEQESHITVISQSIVEGNYLRVTNLQVGLIINYKHPKLEWERLVLDTAR